MSLSKSSFHPVEEMIHGVHVRDPYRWLEDRGLPETNQWIEVQKERCQTYFSSCDTLDVLRRRVRDLLNVEAVDQPAEVGGYYFYRRRNRDQEQACIYVQERSTGLERLLVDPSGLGPFASVAIHRISEDAALLAYEIKHGGGDAKEIRMVDVTSGLILTDRIRAGYTRGFVFASGNDGFYLCHEDSSGGSDHLIQFHSRMSGEDRPVLARPRQPGSRLVLVADASHLGAIWIHPSEKESVWDFFVAPRERDDDWRLVFRNETLLRNPICYEGKIFALSYENAPNGRLVELALDGQEIRTVVPEGHGPARQIVIAGQRFFVNYFIRGCPSIRSWSLDGREAERGDFPTDGTIQLLPQFASNEDSLFYSHESFSQPPLIYQYTTGIERSSLLSRHEASPKPAVYQVRELSFRGKDGTDIPITIVVCGGTKHSSKLPVIMTGYGGFGVPMTPRYSVLVAIMMELGAVFALPHIRGGGEFGDAWHDGGRARNRQTAIDDFVAAAEWLSTEGITNPAKLAIFGGSNSGLLVAAAMTQRPDLFRAILCIAPLLDMVRYECFDQAVKWQREYGSVNSAEDFHALHAYSPYHQVRWNLDYPATLFVSGDKDDRCNPAHVRKMAAALQERAAQSNPILVDYSAERGHSPVLPLSVRVEALALRLAFLCRELSIEIAREACHEAANC
jgi:prolyl oligopeptidase